jgi:RHS repeat-associated protein
MPTRSWTDPNSQYKYGFNGKEKDDEGLGGSGTTYDYGFRIYNPNLGRFLSVDPLFKSYPWYTPFQFAGNMPISAIDLDGLEEAIYIEIQCFGITYLRFWSYVDEKNRVDNTKGTYMHIVLDGWKVWTKNYQKFLKSYAKDKEVKKIVDAPADVQEKINDVIEKTNGEKNMAARSIELKVTSAVIKFDVNVSTVDNAVKNMTTEAKNQLQEFAVILLNMPSLGLDIQGFADAQNGTTENGKKKNQELSENRAIAAKTYINNFLKEKGVSDEKIAEINKRIYTKGNGQVEDGTVDNSANRRVDVKLVNSDGTDLSQEQGQAALPDISY